MEEERRWEKKEMIVLAKLAPFMFLSYIGVFIYVVSATTLSNESVEVNLFVVYLGEILGDILISIFSSKLPRKKLFYGIMLTQATLASVLLIFSFFELNENPVISIANLTICTLI